MSTNAEYYLSHDSMFQVVGQSVLRLYRMGKDLPMVRSLMPEIPEVFFSICKHF